MSASLVMAAGREEGGVKGGGQRSVGAPRVVRPRGRFGEVSLRIKAAKSFSSSLGPIKIRFIK